MEIRGGCRGCPAREPPSSFSSKDSVLPVQGPLVLSLVKEPRSHMQCDLAKRFFKRWKEEGDQAISNQVLPSPVSLLSSRAVGVQIEVYAFSWRSFQHLTVLYLAETADNLHACCFAFTTRTIPRSHVENYQRTSDMCPQPGIM